MYSKYMTKAYKGGPISVDFVLRYLRTYKHLDAMMQSSRVNLRMFPHIGGVLIYSNSKMTKVAKELLIPKKSVRRIFRVQSPYTQAL